jgi:hypothetical protein
VIPAAITDGESWPRLMFLLMALWSLLLEQLVESINSILLFSCIVS